MSAPAPETSTWQELVQAELEAFFAERSRDAMRFGAQFERLWELARENSLGGKLLRPRMLLEVFDTLRPDGIGWRTAVELSVAVELLHLAFLLHDDVIDGDLLRRGHPNLVGTLVEDHGDLNWAHSSAILMGDLLTSASHLRFARIDTTREVRQRVLDHLERIVTETVAGEHADVGLSVGVIEPDIATVVDMTTWKTAAYTCELPLRLAAILAGAPPALEETLAAIGRRLGLVYQLQDDLLSTFGEASLHGKDRWSDLREGKQTALVAHARGSAQWGRIEPLLGTHELTEEEALQIVALLEECGARRFVEDLVEEQLHSTRQLITGGALPGATRLVLLRIQHDLEGRQS